MKRKIYRSNEEHNTEHFILDDNTYANICDIIGDITDTSLELQFKGDGSYTDGKTINVPYIMPFTCTTLTDDKTHYTMFEHELAHILFQTDISNFELFVEWFIKYSDKHMDAYLFSSGFDDKQIDEFHAEWKILDWQSILKTIFDRVECHRVEHNWGEVYFGSRTRFKELRKGLGKTQTEKEIEDDILNQHLTNTLLISRIYKDEILTQTAIPDLLNTNENVAFCVERFANVENDGAARTLIECKLIIQRWMPVIFRKFDELTKKGISITECPMTEPNQYTDQFEQDLNRICMSSVGAGRKKRKVKGTLSKGSGDSGAAGTQKGCKTKKISETLRNEYLQDVESLEWRRPGILPKSKGEEPEEGDDEEEGGDSDHKALRKASIRQYNEIMSKARMKIDTETYDGQKIASSRVIGKIMETDIYGALTGSERYNMRKIDPAEVNKLRRFFSSVRSKNKTILSEEGDSVDPEAYIQFKANPEMHEIFTSEDTMQGLDVSIVIDLSGSMTAFHKLDLACKYAKTLYKALESLPNVVLKAWVFSGYHPHHSRNHGLLTPVIEVDYSRLSTIDADGMGPAPFTHTWNAIAHVAYKMRGSSGKKLMIVISDGMPYDGDEIIQGLKATKDSVDYSFMTGTKVYGIQISEPPPKHAKASFTAAHNRGTEKLMTAMFGPRKNWTVVDNMKDAKHHVITEVVKGVYRTLVTYFIL